MAHIDCSPDEGGTQLRQGCKLHFDEINIDIKIQLISN